LAAPSRDSTQAPIEDTAPMRLERLCWTNLSRRGSTWCWDPWRRVACGNG
jgi:hypothetical protein